MMIFWSKEYSKPKYIIGNGIAPVVTLFEMLLLHHFHSLNVVKESITSKERKKRKMALSHVWLLQPYGMQPARRFCPWDFPSKNTRLGCHFLLQGIFPTQELNPGFQHCRQILYQLSYVGSSSVQFTSKGKFRKNEVENLRRLKQRTTVKILWQQQISSIWERALRRPLYLPYLCIPSSIYLKILEFKNLLKSNSACSPFSVMNQCW